MDTPSRGERRQLVILLDTVLAHFKHPADLLAVAGVRPCKQAAEDEFTRDLGVFERWKDVADSAAECLGSVWLEKRGGMMGVAGLSEWDGLGWMD